MTAAGLVRLAGGLKRSAYTDEADLTSYMIEHGDRIVSDHQTIHIAKRWKVSRTRTSACTMVMS